MSLPICIGDPRLAWTFTDGISYGEEPVRSGVSEENKENTPAETLVPEAPAKTVAETPVAEAPTKPAAKPKLLQDAPVSVGRVVHYLQHEGGRLHMAHVCCVHSTSSEMVNLDVVDENGHHYAVTSVKRGKSAGTWRWPARVEA